MFTALTLSWNFIGGFAGYPSFSTAAFFGLGCYVGRTVAAGRRADGAGLGHCDAVRRRVRGRAWAPSSCGCAATTSRSARSASSRWCGCVVSSWGSVTGGGDGLNLPLLSGGPNAVARIFLAGDDPDHARGFLTTVWVDRSRLGFGLRCIQQNEDAANMVGVNTTRYKIIAYTLSALFCGTVGASYASWTGYIDPTESFSILMSIKIPVMCLLGGPGTVLGRSSAPPRSRCSKRCSGQISSITTAPFSAPSSSS